MNIKLQMHCSSKEVACAPAPTATMIDYYNSTKYEVHEILFFSRQKGGSRIAGKRFK